MSGVEGFECEDIDDCQAGVSQRTLWGLVITLGLGMELLLSWGLPS
jgi:hypothetical protein